MEKADNEATRAFWRYTVTSSLLHVCYGLVFPVMPLRPQEILDGDESAGAYWHGFTMFLNGLMGMLVAPVIGSMSDKTGRKRLLVLVMSLSVIEFSLAGGFITNDIYIFAIGRAIGGAASTHWSLLTAVTMDVCEAHEKSGRLGLITGISLGVGFVIGPVVGGLLGDVYPRVPFITAAALAAITAISTYIFLPETAPGARGSINMESAEEDNTTIQDANPVRALALLGKDREMVWLSCSFLFGALGFEGFASSIILYLNYKFHWTKQELGSHMGMMGLSFFVAQTILLPFLSRRVSDHKVALFSCVWGVLIGLVYACANSTIIFYVALVIGPCALQGVVITSMMSNRLDHTDQGKLGGCIVVMDRCGRIFGSIVLTSLFAYLTSTEREEPFPEVIPFIVGFLSFFSYTFLAMISESSPKGL